MQQLLVHGLDSARIQAIQALFSQELFVRPVAKETLASALGDDVALALVGDGGGDAASVAHRASLFDAIFNQAPIGITISHGLSPGDTVIDEILDVNPTFERIVGYRKEDLTNIGWSTITHPDDLERERPFFRQLIAGEIDSYRIEKRYIRPDGSIVWTQIVVAPIDVGLRDHYNHICLIQDISERKIIEDSLKESERSRGVLLTHLPGMVYRCKNDEEWTMTYVSPGCVGLTGYSQEALIGNREVSFNEIIEPSYTQELHRSWEAAIREGRSFSGEYEIITRDGERKWVWELGQGIVGEDGRVEELEGLILSINARKRVEAQLRYHSQHDLATGLFNRHHLEELLSSALAHRPRPAMALVAVNLSGLHASAMTYGLLYSQQVLKEVAGQLQTLCRPSYTLCVIHEYQFVFHIHGYAGKGELNRLSESIAEQLTTPLAMEGISWGTGIVEISPGKEHEVQDLLRKLLVVSEQAAQRWGGGHLFFDEQMERQIHQEEVITGVLSDLASGVESGNLYLLFQPIIAVDGGRIIGFEALARLDIPSLGTISPLQFIPIAEKTKLIIPLGESIIIAALRFLDTLSKHGYDGMRISINISALQLLKQGFSSNLLRTVRAMGVNATAICLEITESTFASNYQEINKILRPLRKAGMQIAIDDFGTGYSSLARERELEVDCLKIDKFFVDKLSQVGRDISITSDIISMAHKLGHIVVAEGVEEESQLSYLQEHGCDLVQGYLFSRPLAEVQALAFLSTYKP